MTDPYFMGVAKSICGITHDSFGSLLSSVPVEQVFGDLRDAAKRHSKQELTTGSNIHSVVARSCAHRNAAVQTITPQNCDWSRPLAGKAVKKNVFDAGRATDISLGVCTTGLTKKKSVTEFTKPHVFAQRLELISLLQKLWRNGDEQFSVESAFRKLWISSLAERGLLLQIHDLRQIQIVLKGGPYGIRCMPLVECPGQPNHYTLESTSAIVIMDLPVVDIEKYSVCCSIPVVSDALGKLCWTPSSDWMRLPVYVAKHSIVRSNHKVLTALCSLLKIKGHSKLSFRMKVQLYMRHFGESEARIEEILQQIPDKKPRAKAEGDGNQEGFEKTTYVAGRSQQVVLQS